MIDEDKASNDILPVGAMVFLAERVVAVKPEMAPFVARLGKSFLATLVVLLDDPEGPKDEYDESDYNHEDGS